MVLKVRCAALVVCLVQSTHVCNATFVVLYDFCAKKRAFWHF